MTVKELMDELLDRLAIQKAHSKGQREVAGRVALTAVEDAQMRYTRARAIQEGKFNPADLDK
jgi:hypothetical protein